MLKLQKIKRLFLLALLIAALPGVALAQDTSTLPDEVVVEREGFFPEESMGLGARPVFVELNWRGHDLRRAG